MFHDKQNDERYKYNSVNIVELAWTACCVKTAIVVITVAIKAYLRLIQTPCPEIIR